jgi:hypothetical protein
MYIFRSGTDRVFLASNVGLSKHITSPVCSRRRSFLRNNVVPLMSVPFPEVSSTNTSISGGGGGGDDEDDVEKHDNDGDNNDSDPPAA